MSAHHCHDRPGVRRRTEEPHSHPPEVGPGALMVANRFISAFCIGRGGSRQGHHLCTGLHIFCYFFVDSLGILLYAEDSWQSLGIMKGRPVHGFCASPIDSRSASSHMYRRPVCNWGKGRRKVVSTWRPEKCQFLTWAPLVASTKEG